MKPEMSDSEEDYLDQSIINTSAFCSDDLNLFVDCLTEICHRNTSINIKTKKNIRSRERQRHKKNHRSALNKTTAFENDEQYMALRSSSSCFSLNESVTDTTLSSINQSSNECDVSCISEQFNDIFAYFSEDVVTDKTLFEDSDESREIISPRSSREEKKTTAPPKRVQMTELQTKSRLILRKIADNEDDTKFKKPFEVAEKIDKKIQLEKNVPSDLAKSDERLNRTSIELNGGREKTYSSMSTLSLHESDSDTNSKRSSHDVNENQLPMKVRDRISYFNETIKSIQEAKSSSVSTPSTSEDDEERTLQRQKSKRRFQENRNYFEKMFKERMLREAILRRNDDENKKKSKSKIVEQKYENDELNQIDYSNEKLNAIRTYVQTKYLLERIQYLIKAITNMDEKRLEKMNLKLLKKFLIFIRDCSYKCQSVCFEIGENFLSDFEMNVLSAEELLISALKSAQLLKVE